MWSPWISADYAVQKVTDSLGGPDAMYNYLGQEMPVRDVPKDVVWFPFARAVYFPSEAVWFVTFYGRIL